MKLRRPLVAALAVTATLVFVTPSGEAAQVAPAAAAATTDWAAPGPYAVSVEVRPNSTYYRPSRLDGKHPVIIWGNGTGAVPEVYSGLLRHLASHGFIVAAANTKQSNSGQEMLVGAAWLKWENSRPGSPYYQKVDVEHVGAIGHSQGGAGAINAGANPVVDATLALEPGPLANPGALRGPVLFLAGENDKIVNPDLLVKPLYARATQVPAWYAELGGANHFTPVPDGGGFRGTITAWFRYNLSGDQQAAAEFTGACGICTDPAYVDVRRNSRAGG
ncbi:acetylxylan esterase [Actinokineospora sp. PR83]|uniref:poly(ethylene terephthalate) hydrolase family protein n=1 Tax=Actinokineospora sp. PR83 TaxID=2884908 RepID=UPI002714968D|nr:acetylxylan esterase [Actinokineospora sp. PR83]